MIQASFKYNIGDIVTLIKLPDWFDKNRSRCSSRKLDEFSPKQYKIRGYSFTILGDGSYEYRYSLHAYNDDWLDYHNWLTEDYLSGEGTYHDVNVCFKSADGADLNIGDIVYTSLYYGSDVLGDSCSVTCTFTRKIKVTELIYTNEEFSVPTKKLVGDRIKEFRVPVNGSRNKDCELCNHSLKNITEQFICDFVKTCKEYRINPRNEKLGDYKSRKFWLDELGIFDDVCKRYNSRSKKTSKVREPEVKGSSNKESSNKESSNKGSSNKVSSTKTNKKVEEILSGLSDEEKKEMLKLLIKE